jgi:hypothetical protein
MSAIQALKAAHDAGVRMGIDGEALTLDADGAPSAYLLNLLAHHKAGVIALLRPGNDGWSAFDWLAYFDERAGIAEHNGGLSREQAETRAFTCCVVEWRNRNPVRSPPGRCVGCGQGERDFDSLLPFGTEAAGIAWLHPRCRQAWQTGRTAEAVASLTKLGIPYRGRTDDKQANHCI